MGKDGVSWGKPKWKETEKKEAREKVRKNGFQKDPIDLSPAKGGTKTL
jgi:hypothetical protein